MKQIGVIKFTLSFIQSLSLGLLAKSRSFETFILTKKAAMPQPLLFNAFVLICIFATAIIAIPAPIPLPKSSYIHPRCMNPSLSLHFTLLTRTSPPTPRPIILHPSPCPLRSRLLQPRFDLCHHRFLYPTTTATAPENLDHVHELCCRRPVPYHSPRHWLSGGR